ncbi:MAG: hypothetical protein JXR60_09485 [Bacteroidales bacterium]|nr:hypothetical protein [Bacteroidales bacterium]
MKKFIYISGILAANLMFLGAIFKVMHWPGASILLVASVFTLSFIFLPAGLNTAYRKSQTQKYKASYIVAYIVFSFVFIGSLFKIQHWPGASLLMLIGIPLPIVLFLPVYLFQTRKDKEYSMINFMGIMFGMTFVSVFSAMLSINNSASVLNNLEDQYQYQVRLVKYNYERPQILDSSDPIQEKANSICSKIKVLKDNILTASNNPSVSEQFKSELPNVLAAKDNVDIPARIVWFDKGSFPLTEIKNMLEELNQSISTSNTIGDEQKALCEHILSVKPVIYASRAQDAVSWENNYFADKNLVMILDVLTRLERNIRFVQTEIAKI